MWLCDVLIGEQDRVVACTEADLVTEISAAAVFLLITSLVSGNAVGTGKKGGLGPSVLQTPAPSE